METRVQFRGSAEDLEFLRQQGVSANDVAKKAFEAEIERLRADGWLARLRELQAKMPKWETTGAEMAREARRDLEERH